MSVSPRLSALSRRTPSQRLSCRRSAAGFVYFTPLFGALIADRWLGAKKTVMIGIVLMTAGHFAIVFDASFLAALFLLVIGSGWVARFYETMPGWQFWGMHAALCFAGALLLAVFGPLLRRRMDRLDEAALAPS
jgi:dipeptide/tripeptide permease